jgi:hypothetical protein
MLSVNRLTKAARSHASRIALKLTPAEGAAARWCNACGRGVAGFFRYGPRKEWGCPYCKASPRERFVRHLQATGVLRVPGPGCRILHVAPSEQSLISLFAGSGADYVPADLSPENYPGLAVQPLDLCTFDAEWPYDLVYASHVLEHVPDDGRALRNVAANLTVDGEAWIIVPLHDRPTEDGADLPAKERERRFGQWDHVRQYGPDVAGRLQRAGFAIERLSAADLPQDVQARQGLDPADVLWRCRPVAVA